MAGRLKCGASRKCCGTVVSLFKDTKCDLQRLENSDISEIVRAVIMSSIGPAVRVENRKLTCEKSELRKKMLVNLFCGTPGRVGETDQMK